MNLSKKKRNFFMKCGIIAISVVVATVPAQMILVFLVVVLYYSPSVSNIHNIVGALVFFFVVVLTIGFSIIIFKKVHNYLDKRTKLYIENK